MKKAIIFDLNGVFIISPKLSERFEKDFNISVSDFIPALSEIMDKVRMPKAENLYSLWKPYFSKWGIRFTEEEFLDYWFHAEKENKDLTDLARRLKEKGFKIFVLSNNFRERAKYYSETFPFLAEIFDKVYYSWETGFVKPDSNAYKNILQENNLNPEECLYFDDSEKNIAVANSLGIESYLFDEDNVKMLNFL